jgi:D-arginine dehydrogenase
MSELPDSARVAIVGGGFAGAATAYFLARRGVRDVVLLEREPTCGAHASGRNAALGRQLPSDERFTDLALAGAAFLRSPPPGFSDARLLSGSGSMLLAGRDERLASLLARARARGLAHEVLTPAAVAARFPALGATPMVGAVAFPTDGVIDIHALLSGFLRGARAGGARIVTDCGVHGIRVGDRSVAIETTRGALRAEVIVIAAGAWAGQVASLAGARGHAFDPVRRHLFVTTPGAAAAAVPRDAPFAWHLDDEFYARPEGAGYLVSACDQTVVEPCEPAPQPEAASALADKLLRMAPPLAELGIASAWACLRTFTRGTRRPVIGWDARLPRLFWVAGLAGHGATSSPAVGAEAAAALVHRL